MTSIVEVEELGRRIRKCRLDSRMTLKAVEQASGLSATHLSEIERPALIVHARNDHTVPYACAETLARSLPHAAVGAQDRELGQAVRTADLEVDRVVTRRHLERARAEVRVDTLVGDHGNAPFDERHDDLASISSGAAWSM